MTMFIGIVLSERASQRRRAATSDHERMFLPARRKVLKSLQAILPGATTSFVFGRGDLPRQIRSRDAEPPP